MWYSTRLWGICSLIVIWLAVMVAPVQAAGPEGPKANVHGTVINWGYRPEPNVKVRLSGGGWALECLTNTDGRFAFDDLGDGVGTLEVVLPKDSGLQPMTTDLAVPFSGPETRVVNLGIYSGTEPPTGLPMSLTMKASATKVKPGDTVKFTMVVKNLHSDLVSGVMVTDLFPTGLTPTEIEDSRDSRAWIGGQFAASSIGLMNPGEAVTVTITAKLASDMPPDRPITNRASLIYQESAAIQTEVTLNGPPVTNHFLPETGYGVGLPVAALVLLATAFGLRRLRLNHPG